jgi:hypothetical protein
MKPTDFFDKISKAPEQKILQEIDSIRWSFEIFYGNYQQLANMLGLLEDKPETISLWDEKKRKELHAVFSELGRLVFNYLSASSMLIDHTRRYVNDHSGPKYLDFKRDYDEEIKKRFIDNETHHLAKGLRNYIQHRTLPGVGGTLSYTRQTGLNKSFGIPVSSLLQWDKWSEIARAKLERCGDSFSIREFTDEYFHQIQSFHKWLWNKQVEIHQVDIDRLNKLKSEAREAFISAGLISQEDLKRMADYENEDIL